MRRKIIDIDTNHATPKLVILLETGKKVSIAPYTWESYRFYLEGSALKSTITGTFTQYPVILAWALPSIKAKVKPLKK